jgi:CRISPR/Cas system Type II protein with McrA/HNH and RuvC-like nuclease domain
MQTAPQSTRKDLAKLLGIVTGLVMELSREEIELRRTKKTESRRQQELQARIEQAIVNFEQWLVLAHLQNG